MVSGIDSLAATHEQVFVGWTGDIDSTSSASEEASGSSEPATPKISAASLADEDKKELEGILSEYRSPNELKDGKKIQYVPVWLDDKDAHGHYDGYCKQSECILHFVLSLLFFSPFRIPSEGHVLAESGSRLAIALPYPWFVAKKRILSSASVRGGGLPLIC